MSRLCSAVSFTFVLLMMFSAASYSQPSSFTVSGCNPDVDGTYIQSVDSPNGCPCYERQGSTHNIHFSNIGIPMGWNFYGSNCGDKVQNFTGTVVFAIPASNSCNILDADPSTCSLSQLNVNDVPTLSQWSLIILGLIMLNLGLLTVLQLKGSIDSI